MISGAAIKSSLTGLIVIIVELAEYETFFVTICISWDIFPISNSPHTILANCCAKQDKLCRS